MGHIGDAKKALRYYLRNACTAAGLSWSVDNDAEVNGIVDDIVKGIKDELREELRGDDKK